MPITPAHLAAILPFRRFSKVRGWRSALFWGSVSPDLPSIPLVSLRQFTHSAAGLVGLDIPMAILLAFLWNKWGRRRLERLPGIRPEPPGPFSWSAALIGASVGGTTHVVWDLFTHERSPVLRQCAMCSTKLFDSVAGPISLRQLSWPLNSLLGMLVLAVWLLLQARRAPGWLKIFLCPSWARLLFLPPLPLLLVLSSFHPRSTHPFKELFLAVLLHPKRIRRLCAASLALGLCVFAWETRVRADRSTNDP